MLFQFKLLPLEEVTPWGPGTPSLSWFSLSLGWYWWMAGSQQLFRYSQTRIDQVAAEYPNHYSELPYEDYQLARPWEDLLDHLPAILDRVPDDLIHRVQDTEKWESLQKKAFVWAEAKNDRAAWNLQGLASQWWSDREWDAGYLRCPPKIWLWTQDDIMHLKWDNRGVIDEGILVWDATLGEITMPVTEFLAEVTSFHERLMAAMAERVEAVLSGALHPEIAINLDGLVKEQEDRATWLENTLTMRRQNQDWNEVRAAISTVERMCYNDGVEGL